MATGRPPFSVFLVDFPSDHEIDEGLSTECEMIAAIVHNRGFTSATKTVRISSEERFREASWRSYPNVGFVHLAGHGTSHGVGLIGGHIPWQELAEKLKIIAPQLTDGQQRVLNISTCYSADAFETLKPLLKRHFTGAYNFEDQIVYFSDKFTAWAMFYNKKTLEKPHEKVAGVINDYFYPTGKRKMLTFRAL